jgi:hypothetical protein
LTTYFSVDDGGDKVDKTESHCGGWGEGEKDKRCDDIDEELEIHLGRFFCWLLRLLLAQQSSRREGWRKKEAKTSSKFVVMSIMCYLHNDRFFPFSASARGFFRFHARAKIEFIDHSKP